MSLNFKYIAIIVVLFLGCAQKEKIDAIPGDLTKKEKDSLSQRYHQISNYYLQPSHMYRVYKDSSLMFDPENVEVRQKLSYSYKKKGEHIMAMEVLNEAVARGIEQNNTDVIGYRAWSLLYYYRDYEGAIRDIDRIEEMTSQPYNVCWGEPCGFQKGQAYYKLKKYDQAIEAFTKVNVEEEKKGFDTSANVFLLFYMARCYEEKGDLATAIQLYNQVLNGYKFPEALFRLGKIQAGLSNYPEALKYFELAKENMNYKMQEPYIERFDELFPYMIDKEVDTLKQMSS